MAEQTIKDVVNEVLSTGDPSPVDATATTSTFTSTGNGEANPVTSASNTAASLEPTFIQTDDGQVFQSKDQRLDGSSDEYGLDAAKGPDVVVELQGDSFVVVNEPVLNGIGAERPSLDDVVAHAALIDGSGGSDTDTSKGDGSDQHKDGPSRKVRSNSIKKPTSFKTVSVTKNFLAKAATAAPVSRSGDKVGTVPGQSTISNLSAAKPRLVAKSGTVNGLPRSGVSKFNGGGGAGPDASKVWNKNRPVPPPPPKQFTDEELKQQYGIHMATRLQADEVGKESKWADIEDDEDDWAPDTVEWMDGTKSSVANIEKQVHVKEESKTDPPKSEPVLDAKKPSVVLQRVDSAGTSKTILKPGSLVSANQGKSGGLVLKGAPEKPALLAKSPAPAPTKSPWAPLPPIEKVSPVVINPQTQPAHTSRFGHTEPNGSELTASQPSPAKEIAADDFNRSWREDRGNKELFNSHSGRYEPVGELRRGSLRNDNSHRQQPSVLQRPPPPGQASPAEPSPAFQTYRAGPVTDSGSWNRQRTSSNVSGGSGAQTRRLSEGKHQETLPTPTDDQIKDRRPLHLLNGPDSGSPGAGPKAGHMQHKNPFLDRGASPTGAAGHGQVNWSPRPSPSSSHVQTVGVSANLTSDGVSQARQGAPPSDAATSPDVKTSLNMEPVAIGSSTVPDPIALQKQIMREKREMARLRKKEEEEKEEAAKRERIKLKMASLGMPSPDSKEKPKEPATQTQAPALAPTEKPLLPHSPPKPPIPTSSGEVAQYGMIKVHQPQSLRKQVFQDASQGEKSSAKQQGPEKNAQVLNSSARPGSLSTAQSPKAAAPRPGNASETGIIEKPPIDKRAVHQPPQNLRLDQQEQQWKQPTANPENYSNWPGNTITSQTGSTGNVWGPPNRDRALGNGTFESGYSRVAPRQLPAQPASTQAAATRSIRPASSIPKVSSGPQGNTERLQGLENSTFVASSEEIRAHHPKMQPQLNDEVPSKTVGVASFNGAPRPIGPPIGGAVDRPSQVNKRYDASAWHNLPSQLAKEEQDAREKYEQERQSGALVEHQPIFKETFKQTARGDGFGKRRVINTQTTVHDPHVLAIEKEAEVKLPPDRVPRHSEDVTKLAPPPASLQPESAGISNSQPTNMNLSNPIQPSMPIAGGRSSSRFFPRSQEPVAQTMERPMFDLIDSAPPPDSLSHPAYMGDSSHPIVNLPVPKAVVKLPPASPSPPKPASLPVRVESFRVGPQPIVKQIAWQDRFNGLLKDFVAPVAPPPRQQTLAITSASRAPLDISSQQHSATVSLPIKSNHQIKNSEIGPISAIEVTSKSSEEDLLENREFGSLPTICLPKVPHQSAQLPPAPTKHPRAFSRQPRYPEVTTKESNLFSLRDVDQNAAGYFLNIRLPGDERTKIAVLARPPEPESPSGNGARRRFSKPREAQLPPQGFKARKPSGNFQGHDNQMNGSPRMPNTRWGDNRTASQGSMWKKRLPGVVH